jgi:RHS repeat-associated protein
VKNSIGQTAAQTTYAYDEYATQSSGSPQLFGVTGSRGNVTTITQSTGSTPLTQHLHYFDNGNVYTATDVNNAVTTYTYGACGNSLLTQTALPVSSLTTQAMWNCTGGVQTSVTDANNKTTTTYYNDSQNTWRPTSATDPTGATTSLTYYTSGTPKGSEGALIFNSSASTVDTRTSLDALGRIRVSQTKWSPSSPNYDSTETDYDPAGRPSRVTVPYQATVGVTNSNAPATKTTYDALNRPATVTDGGGGTVSYAYDRNDVLVTLGPRDSIGFKQRQLEYDALGRLTSVCEMTTASGSGYGTCGQTVSQSGYWTKYTYDALGNVLTVTQNAQTGGSPQTRGYTYDQLGRMLSETNPESGTYHYAYDTDSTCGTYNGDLVKRTDAVLPPNATVTCYAYDALHRVTAISYPNGYYASATQVKHFVYDQSAALNSLGRLGHAYTCSASTGDCSNWLTDLGFVYSARGEVTDVYQKSPNSGGYYHASAGYWPTGPQGLINTLSLNLSGVPTWTYNPDGEGRILSVSASSGQSPVTSASYNLFSLPTNVTLGSGDADTFGYDGNTGRMTSYNAALGVSPWVTLAVSGPQSGTSYYDTDSFTVTVHGAASAQVAVGTTTCTGAYPMGQTNGNGDWFLPGRWTAGNVGTYTQLWCVNGVAATPTLNFSVVSSTPTPAGPTSSLLGPSTSGTLTWNQNGTLAEVAAMDGFNAGNSQACAYTHDDLGRLGQIDCGTNNGSLKWGQNFSYDSLGNIKWLPMDGHSGTRFQFGYDPNTNHFVGQSYDANGNLLADGAHTYTWDAEGNMISVSDTSTTTVIYDALGRRVEQNGGSASAELLYGPDGSKLAVMSGQTVIKALVPLPGGATAVYNSSGLAWYRHPDWLGSSRIASTPTTRTMYYDGAYSPFGETMAEAGTADRNFTGQNQDVRPDLYDFMYRDYHPSHGRWISPDPAGMGSVNAADPQTWNRYGYVRNSPLANIDPDGQDCVPCFVFIAPTNPVGAIIGGLISLGLDLWSFFGGGGGPPAGPPMPSAPPALGGFHVSITHIEADYSYSDLNGGLHGGGGGGGGVPLPMYCQPDVIKAMGDAWRQSSNGSAGREASFRLDGTPSSYKVVPQSYTNEWHMQRLTIIKGRTFFLFHVHPNGGRNNWMPSTPGNNFENNPFGDTGYADLYHFQTYVGSSNGLGMYDPATRGPSVLLRKNLDWLKPCSQ